LFDMAMNLRPRALFLISPTLLLAFALTGCGSSGQQQTAAAPPPPPPPPPAEHVPPPEAAKADPPPAPPATRIISDATFSTPESVFYDAAQDVYFVSNINGDPLAKDNNGFIAKVTPEGQVAKFVEGGKPGITLNAPKGIAIVGDTLLVADIDTVRIFNRTSGEAKGEIAIKGATFLNDLSVGADGKTVYASDTGFKAGFKPAGTDALYTIVDGKVTKLPAKAKDLAGPNGLLAADGGVWAVTFGSGELYFVDAKGKKDKAQKLEKGQLDGIVQTKDGKVLVSSWEGSAVYGGKPGEAFTTVISGVDTPADIGYDSKRNVLLIPLFKKNAIVLHSLDSNAPAVAPAAAAPPPAPAPAAPLPGAKADATSPAPEAKKGTVGSPAAAKEVAPTKPTDKTQSTAPAASVPAAPAGAKAPAAAVPAAPAAAKADPGPAAPAPAAPAPKAATPATPAAPAPKAAAPAAPAPKAATPATPAAPAPKAAAPAAPAPKAATPATPAAPAPKAAAPAAPPAAPAPAAPAKAK
jgi:sugar lactone lactonase YvrE